MIHRHGMFRGVFPLTKKKGPRLKHSKYYPNESPLRKLLSCGGKIKMPLNLRCVTHGIWRHHGTWPEDTWRGLKESWVPMELLARFLGRINFPFMFFFFFRPVPLYQTSLSSSISFAFLPQRVQWVRTFLKWFTSKRELNHYIIIMTHHDFIEVPI